MKKSFYYLSLKRILAIAVSLMIVFCSVSAVIFLVDADTTTNLVVNGGFEDGLTGYQYTEKIDAVDVKNESHSGEKSAKLGAKAGTYHDALFYQEITVKPNTDYVWTFWFSTGSNNNTLVGVRTADGTKLVPSDISSSNGGAIAMAQSSFTSVRDTATPGNWHQGLTIYGWKEFSVKFNSGDQTKVLLTLNLFTNSRKGWTDDWSVVELETQTPPDVPDDEPEVNTAVINGGFEDDLNGYKTTDKITTQIVSDEFKSGAKSVKLGATASAYGSAFLYQEIEVKANTDYVWTFWYKSESNNNVLTGVRTADGSKLLPSTISSSNEGVLAGANISFSDLRSSSSLDNWHQGMTNNEWKRYSIEFNTCDEVKVLLTLDMFYQNRIGWTDDWSVKEKTEETGIVNGDFEEGLYGFYSTSQATVSVITDNVHSGNKAVKLGATGAWNNALFHYEVSVKQNTDYIWSFWYNSSSGNNVLAGVRASNGSQLLPSTISSDNGGTLAGANLKFDSLRSISDANNWHQGMTNYEWKKYSISFNSGSETKVLLTLNTFYDNRIGVTDDWSLIEVDPNLIAEISNGDFENGLTDYETSNTIVAQVVTDEVYEGEKAIKLGAASAWNNAFLYQVIDVKPNTDYIWNFWYKSGSGNNILAGVCTSDGSQLLPSTISSMNGGVLAGGNVKFASLRSSNDANNWHQGMTNYEWKKYSISFNSGSNMFIRLSLNMFADSRIGWTDDWSITERVYNMLENPGFEDGIDEFRADGAAIAVDSENANSGNNALKISGAGKVVREVEVRPFYRYEWKFYFKSDAEAGFAVAGADGETLLPSKIVINKGNGTASPESYDSLRTQGYHNVSSSGDYTEYVIQFDSDKYEKLYFTYYASENITAYTDDWFLFGEKYYGKEEILNADFEGGFIEPYDADAYVTYSITDENPHSGNYAASINKNSVAGSGKFIQTVEVKPNSDYMWTFWLKFDSEATPVGAQVNKNQSSTLQNRIGGDCGTVIEPAFDWHRIRYSDSEWHQYKLLFSTGNAELVDLVIYCYAADAQLVTDDWSLEYIGDTVIEDVVFNIDFESEKMGAHPESKPSWTVSNEEYHSGNNSLKFDGRNASSQKYLLYLDEYGVIRENVTLDLNSDYRISFWYKGTGKIEMANLTFKLYSGNDAKSFSGLYGAENEEWNYFEYILSTESTSSYRLQFLPMFVGSSAFNIYIDDIRLEKITTGVTDDTVNPDETVCDDEDNLIPSEIVPAVLDGTNSTVQKLTLKPFGMYNFAVSYNANSANGLIGLSFSEDGSAFSEGKSLFAVNDTQNQTKRSAYTFCAPADGIVYLVLNNNAGTVKIEDVTLYSLLPESVKPKENLIIVPTKKPTASIWDEDFEFDFDWNYEQDDFDFSDDDNAIIQDTDIKDSDTESDESESVPTGKRYRQIKKRALISKGKPGISPIIVVLICIGAGIIACATGFIIIFLVRRKKRRLNAK